MSTSTSTRPKVGQPISVRIHPARNGGHEDAHAVVAGVNPDDTINAWVYPDHASGPFYQPNLPVLTHDEYEQLLRERFGDLPGHTSDAKGRIIPGINPRTDEEWQPYDVLHWHPAAIAEPTPVAPARESESTGEE